MENPLKISKSTNEDDADKSMHLSLSSGSQVESNIDLLTEILIRLPVKSLLRFKSVSKIWLSLIPGSHFSSKHFIQNRHFSVAGLLAVYRFIQNRHSCYDCEFFFLDRRNVSKSDKNPLENLDFLHLCTRDLKILQSCNGLILYQSERFEGVGQRYSLNFHIYNPCTKQCKTLSFLPVFPLRFSIHPMNFISVSLAFDPLKSPHYKLVWIWKQSKGNGSTDCSQVHTYSSKTDSWRLSDYQFDAPECNCRKSGVFWNGSLNWITDFDRGGYCLCYIIDQELLKRVSLPDIPNRGAERNNIYLSESLGHLYFVKSYGTQRLTSLVILEMEKDYSAWTIKYCVGFEALLTASLETAVNQFSNYTFTDFFYFRGSRVLFVKEEEDHFELFLLIPTGQVVSYSTKDMESKEIHILGPQICSKKDDVHQFIESLAHV